MASSGGWLVFSVVIIALSCRACLPLSVRCERGLGNCVDSELAAHSSLLKKRGIQKRRCRFACIGGGKRGMDKMNQENQASGHEKNPVDELIDALLLKRTPMKRMNVESSRPPCQRFHCGKKRSAESPEIESHTAREMKRCGRFGGCKRNMEKETSPLAQQQQQQQQEEQDSRPDCFGLGCKKRELSEEEKPGLPIAPNEKAQEKDIPTVDEDDILKPQCGRFGCKRSNLLQTLAEKISKRSTHPNKLRSFEPKTQERKFQ